MLEGFRSRCTTRLACACSHRAAGLVEQLEARRDRQPAPIAVLGERRATHELHREIGPAVLGDAAVEQPRDVGVLEARQDLALAHEALAHRVRADAAPDQLERHLLLERAVGAFGEVDGPHAAAADLARAGGRGRSASPPPRAPRPRRRAAGRGARQERGGVVVRVQQRLDLRAQARRAPRRRGRGMRRARPARARAPRRRARPPLPGRAFPGRVLPGRSSAEDQPSERSSR